MGCEVKKREVLRILRQVSDLPKYMVMTFNEKKKFWGEAEEFSFRRIKFEKPEGNARCCTDFSEVTGMDVIA